MSLKAGCSCSYLPARLTCSALREVMGQAYVQLAPAGIVPLRQSQQLAGTRAHSPQLGSLSMASLAD